MMPRTPDHRMGFLDHLGELRWRLIRSSVAILAGAVVCWAYKERLVEMLMRPLAAAWRARALGTPTLHFASPVDPFVAYLKVALVGGILLAAPYVLLELWLFVAPGLYPRERRFAIPLLLASIACFFGGALFGWGVVFPIGLDYFIGFSGTLGGGAAALQPTLMMDNYLSLTTKMLFAFGLVFELPVFITFLALARVVTWKQLLKAGRWVVVGAFVVGAILTPPDVGSQILMTVPLIALYYLSVVIAYLIRPRPDAPKN